MTKDEALKLAQKALSNRNAPAKTIYEALAAIQTALAQPEQRQTDGHAAFAAWVRGNKHD